MKSFRFRPSARLQRYLGRELIGDPNLAIIEFVKNAYDAGAHNVYIRFVLTEDPPSLLIADDGSGMTETQFERNWMHPGYSEKSPEAPRSVRKSRTKTDREPVGEKGLGRLAAGRLGSRLDVFTRSSTTSPWLHVPFEWDEFDDMTKAMDEIPIPFDNDPPPSPPVQKGTILLVGKLAQRWEGRVVGRQARGRRTTRLGRLKQDLELLIRPFGPAGRNFAIHLDSDRALEPDDIGTVTPRTASGDAPYVYDFKYRMGRAGKSKIHRALRRSAEILKEFGGRADITRDEEDGPLVCGAFEGRFFFSPPAAARRAKQMDVKAEGVVVYRDGILVEPYGLDGDDWIGVAARKASRQGYALIQPDTFTGYVTITRESNPDLKDMSSRLGLLENEASEAFISHVQSEFRFFESLVFKDLSKRWVTAEEKAARQSKEATSFAALRMRAIAHQLGQPLAGLGADIYGIRLVAKRDDIPPKVRDPLVRLADSAERHLRNAEHVLTIFRREPATEPTKVPIQALVKRAVEEVRPFAEMRSVKLKVEPMPVRNVLVPPDLVVEAIKELVTNGIEAPRNDGTGTVSIGAQVTGGDVALHIRDNGTGSSELTDSPLDGIQSTKGRPGQGLANVVELLQAARGQVRVARSDGKGTDLEVLLPTRVGGLRRG